MVPGIEMKGRASSAAGKHCWGTGVTVVVLVWCNRVRYRHTDSNLHIERGKYSSAELKGFGEQEDPITDLERIRRRGWDFAERKRF